MIIDNQLPFYMNLEIGTEVKEVPEDVYYLENGLTYRQFYPGQPIPVEVWEELFGEPETEDDQASKDAEIKDETELDSTEQGEPEKADEIEPAQDEVSETESVETSPEPETVTPELTEPISEPEVVIETPEEPVTEKMPEIEPEKLVPIDTKPRQVPGKAKAKTKARR
jgi:hypothetical protein